jgi:hypothetical protein
MIASPDGDAPPCGGPQERLRTFLAQSGEATGRRVVPLTGDASDRRYFRVSDPDGSTRVLAVHAGPFDHATLPFVQVAQLLSRMPIPIPHILEHHDVLGILVLEDLGDVTLQATLGGATDLAQAALYRQAVSLVAFLQRRGLELADGDCLPYRIAFDAEKLGWELRFFVKHFVEAYRGVTIAPTVREALLQELGRLSALLAAEPRVLCHRDYHSRNLMWHHDRLYVIDFQDARMGPDTYDLASLLRDSYVDLSEAAVDGAISYFLALTGGEHRAAEFRHRFETMALQRNLKALGTFGYQTTALANPVYTQYIPRTLRYARESLARQPAWSRLREILASLLPELD